MKLISKIDDDKWSVRTHFGPPQRLRRSPVIGQRQSAGQWKHEKALNKRSLMRIATPIIILSSLLWAVVVKAAESSPLYDISSLSESEEGSSSSDSVPAGEDLAEERSPVDLGAQIVEVALSLFGTVFSLSLVISIIRRRHIFPFHALNTLGLIAVECVIPFTLVANSSQGFPFLPCWFQILLWDGLYFPLATFVIFAALNLYLTFYYNTHRVMGKDSFIVRNYHKLTSKKFISVAVLLVGGQLSLPVFLRIYRLSSILNKGIDTPECSDESPLEVRRKRFLCLKIMTKTFALVVKQTLVDGANAMTVGVVMIVGIPIMLKNVRDSFQMRQNVLRGGIVIFMSGVLYTTFVTLGDFYTERDFEVENALYQLADISFVACTHLYSWTVPFRLLRLSYENEKLMLKQSSSSSAHHSVSALDPVARIQQKIMNYDRNQRDPDSKSAVIKYPRVHSISELRAILFGSTQFSKIAREDFAQYLVREFCVENIKFVMASVEFRSHPLPHDRQAASEAMAADFLKPGALLELNLSQSLRQDKLTTYATEGFKKEFWTPVEDEVLQMIIQPWIRFASYQEALNNASTMSTSATTRTSNPVLGRITETISSHILIRLSTIFWTGNAVSHDSTTSGSPIQLKKSPCANASARTASIKMASNKVKRVVVAPIE